MALTVSSHIEENFAVLDLAGNLTLGPTLSSLRETVRGLITSESNLIGIIVCVKGVLLVDSSGLGELMVVRTLATNRQCDIRLVEAPANLKRMLEMTRLEELLRSSESIAAAKAEMKKR